MYQYIKQMVSYLRFFFKIQCFHNVIVIIANKGGGEYPRILSVGFDLQYFQKSNNRNTLGSTSHSFINQHQTLSSLDFSIQLRLVRSYAS